LIEQKWSMAVPCNQIPLKTFINGKLQLQIVVNFQPPPTALSHKNCLLHLTVTNLLTPSPLVTSNYSLNKCQPCW
jgi:hypothetical protein